MSGAHATPDKAAFVAIEGPIGVGKTTLARLIQQAWHAELVLEQFEENPFLPLFYAEPARYAWPTQLHFLVGRFEQWTELRRGHGMLVSDYLFDKDRVFAALNLDPVALRRYLKVYGALRDKILPPSGVILLQANVESLLKRIARRGRSYEQHIQPEYLRDLSREYEQFFSTYADAPVLRLDTNLLNLADNPDDQAKTLALIQSTFML